MIVLCISGLLIFSYYHGDHISTEDLKAPCLVGDRNSQAGTVILGQHSISSRVKNVTDLITLLRKVRFGTITVAPQKLTIEVPHRENTKILCNSVNFRHSRLVHEGFTYNIIREDAIFNLYLT